MMNPSSDIQYTRLQLNDSGHKETENIVNDINKNAFDTTGQSTVVECTMKSNNNPHDVPTISNLNNDADIINANVDLKTVQQHQEILSDMIQTDKERGAKLADETENFENNFQPPILDVNSCQTEQVSNRSNSIDQINSNVRNQTVPIINSRKSSLDSLAQSSILRNYRNASANQINNIETSSNNTHTSRNQTDMFQIPIIGYEIMEERARFTIYKLRIDDPRTGLSWMVFRRYTDFVRLYSKLKDHHPNINLPLPGKRWFKDNFDPIFLDDRVRGLQIFVNVVIRKLYADCIVRDFFCLDEPPPVCDAEPESLAIFGALEDTVGALKNQIRQKEDTIENLKKKVFYLEEKMKECQNCNPTGTTSINSKVEKLSVASSTAS